MISKVEKKHFRVLFLIFILGGLVSAGMAQRILPPIDSDSSMDSGMGGNNSIIGTVILPSGQRLGRRVRVRLFTATRGDITSMTDDNGKFSFRGLPRGDYTVVIDTEKEFEPTTQPVNIIQFTGAPGQTYNVNIRLSLKGTTDSKAGVIDVELAGVPQPAVDFYKKAVEFAKTGDHKAAIEQLLLAIDEYSKFMQAYSDLGVAYVQLKEYEKADEAFQAALKITPEAFKPLLGRGIVLTCLNKFKEAEQILQSALKLNKQSPVGHYYLAIAVSNQNRFDEGEKEFLTSLKLGGDSMREAHRYLAVIYSAKNDKKRELEELQAYLKLVPNAPDAEQLKALVKRLSTEIAKTQ